MKLFSLLSQNEFKGKLFTLTLSGFRVFPKDNVDKDAETEA